MVLFLVLACWLLAGSLACNPSSCDSSISGFAQEKEAAPALTLPGKPARLETTITIRADASERSPAQQPAEPVPLPLAEVAAPPPESAPKAAHPAAPEPAAKEDAVVVLPREQAWVRFLAYEVGSAPHVPPPVPVAANASAVHQLAVQRSATPHNLC